MLLLDAASGRFDLLACARAHLDAADSNCARQITICEHFCGTLSRNDESRLYERLPRSLYASRQALLEIAQANDLMLDSKDIREPALWQSSRERHLAALELRLSATRTVMASARLGSLVSLAGGLAGARPRATANSFPVAVRARGRHEIVKTEVLNGFRCFDVGCHCC